MSLYNITGWSGGGRRPLTYNLRAGQFRNMGGCNIFGSPTRTVINNNFGGGFGYGYDCGCGGDSGVPSWMQWCMGGGMVMNFLGQMMSAIFPGKDSKGADGKGGAKDGDHSADMTMLRPLVKDKYNISGPINGKYMAKDVDTKEIHTFDTFEELQDFVTTDDTSDTKKVDTKTQTYPQDVAETLIAGLKSLHPRADITYIDGKFKYIGGDGKEFNDSDFVKLKDFIKNHPPTPTTTPTTKLTKEQANAEIVKFKNVYPVANIEFDEIKGVFKFNNKEYRTIEELEKALKEKYPNTPTAPATENTDNVTRSAKDLQEKYKDGGIWYNLAKCYAPEASGDTLKAIWRAIKDTNGDAYGKKAGYNNTKIPTNFTIPRTLKVNGNTYTLDENKLPTSTT